MAKFTLKFVRDELSDMFIDLDPANFEVRKEQKSKSTGKKVKVVDKEATIGNMERWLLYYSGVLDAMDLFESKFPDGLDEIVNAYKDDWESLRAYYEEKYPDEYETFSDDYSVGSYEDEGEEDEDDEEEAVDYSEMSLADLRAECKARGIKFTPKHKADALIAMLEENDADSADEEADEDEEESEDETPDYSEMSLGDLRKECKARGLKYSPKHKSEDLIAMLEENDSESEDEEEEEDEDTTEEEGSEYEGMSLGELRKLAKERGIKYTPKVTAEALIEKLEEYDAENADEDEEDEDVADEDEADDDTDTEEEDEEEESDYSEMTLGELRKECKARGLKWSPKHKAEDLIAMLEENDADSDDDEEDSDDEEEDADDTEEEADEDDDEDSEDGDEISEDELDEILDEEFEDETLEEEEQKAPNKGKKLPPKPNKKKN